MPSVGKDTPNVTIGSQTDYKRLYFSEPEAALKVQVSIGPGHGVLKMGTVMAKNTSASSTNKGKLHPYDPGATVTGTENAPGRAYLVANNSSSAVVYVSLDDSYRFIVGDDICISDSDLEANLDNMGAITEIDRTTYPHMAKITATTATGDDFTTAKFAYITLEGMNTAVGILEKSVTTGTGSTAAGADATLILGNCVLYSGMLLNLDSNAATDLSSSTFGQYTYIR